LEFSLSAFKRGFQRSLSADKFLAVLVSNRALREAFLRSGLSSVDLARRLGNPRRCSHVLRALGISAYKMRSDYPAKQAQTSIRETTALRYAEALGLDPMDIEL